MDADRQLVEMLRTGATRHRQLAEQMERMATDLSAGLGEGPTVRAASGGVPTVWEQPEVLREAAANGFRQRHGKKSIAQHVFELLTEEDRDWSPPEMVAAFDRRGISVYRPGSKDRTKNVRFQLAEFAKSGKAIRVSDGRYRAAAPRSPSRNGAGSLHAEEVVGT